MIKEGSKEANLCVIDSPLDKNRQSFPLLLLEEFFLEKVEDEQPEFWAMLTLFFTVLGSGLYRATLLSCLVNIRPCSPQHQYQWWFQLDLILDLHLGYKCNNSLYYACDTMECGRGFNDDVRRNFCSTSMNKLACGFDSVMFTVRNSCSCEDSSFQYWISYQALNTSGKSFYPIEFQQLIRFQTLKQEKERMIHRDESSFLQSNVCHHLNPMFLFHFVTLLLSISLYLSLNIQDLQGGLQTIVTTDSIVFSMISQVNMVIVRAHAFMVNGGVVAPVGLNLVALATQRHVVPIVVLVGSHKPHF
ncbi:hypothetical protein VNO77_03929 [Canavalia gladiata]|uniref:Translation initiation factor eIF2B subunit beta n=1 Tax=Canavalia gladiata TaxID=3824 RepID=A0AAN9MVQ7_CANGL